MKTLAMMKMEKNFVALLAKGYPRKPYIRYSVWSLIHRLQEEVLELEDALRSKGKEEAKLECADVSNLIDYIFEVLSH